MKKLCLINVHLGKLPIYLPLFFRSFEFNPEVDLLFITNQTYNDTLPPNVTIIKVSTPELEDKVEKTLDTKVSLTYPYKLCDLKPFYGLMFADLLRDYIFWGYCDSDLVLGDLSPLLDSSRLLNSDFFSADSCLIVGHFTIFRNTPETNHMPKKIKKWDSKLREPYCVQLDEIGLSEVRESTQLRWDKSKSLRESQITINNYGNMQGHTKGVLGKRHAFLWKEGRTFITCSPDLYQEVLYLHFMGIKRSYHWKRYDSEKTYPAFHFNGSGFNEGEDPWQKKQITLVVSLYVIKTLNILRMYIARYLPKQLRYRLKKFLT